MPWGGIWELNTVSVTGNPIFDYFFTIGVAFILMAVMIAMLVKVISRS